MEYVYQIDNVLTKEVCEDIMKRFDSDERKCDSRIGFPKSGSPGSVNKDVRSSKTLHVSSLD